MKLRLGYPAVVFGDVKQLKIGNPAVFSGKFTNKSASYQHITVCVAYSYALEKTNNKRGRFRLPLFSSSFASALSLAYLSSSFACILELKRSNLCIYFSSWPQ